MPASGSSSGSSSSCSPARSSGCAFFYLVLTPLGVGGTVTAAGRFPRSFFVLEGLLTLAGMGGVRFLVRASTEWQGWRPGDPDRRAGRRRWRASGPDARLRRGRHRRDGPAHDRRRPDGLGMRVVGLIDDDRAQAKPGPARPAGPRRHRRSRRDRPRDRCAPIAHRHPLRVGRGRPPGGRGSHGARASRRGPSRRSTSSCPAGSGADAIREVQVEDLLRREPVVIDESGLRELVAGADGPRDRRRWLDRFRAGPPGVRPRPGAARPARSGRGPALRHRTRASAAGRPRLRHGTALATTARRDSSRAWPTSCRPSRCAGSSPRTGR